MNPESRKLLDKVVVLIAEEHPLSAKIEKKSLEEGGFHVLLAKSWDDLFQCIIHKKIDILLLDIHFIKQKNKISPLELLKKSSLNSNLNIVLTTVETPNADERKSLLKIANKIIEKPIQKNELIEKLKFITDKECRISKRVLAELEATVIDGNKIYKNRLFDISETGFYLVEEDKKIKRILGSTIQLEIILPRHKHPVIFNASIIRKTDLGIGLKIINISTENKEKFIKYIQKLSKSKKVNLYYL